jgi:hypothetical protein
MLLLTSTSDKVQVVTGAAGASVDVHVSWVDNNAGTITPGRFNVVGIATATTTDIVASPGSGVQRNVKAIYITNTSSTTSTQATVLHTDGTNVSDIMGVTLLPGENLVMDDTGHWTHHDTQGGEYTYAGPPTANLGAAGTLAETMPRETCPEVNTTAGSSGALFMQAIYLKAGTLVSNITISSATTAAGTPTNQFYALYDKNRNLLAQSANQTTSAWAANTVRTLAMTTPYRVPTSDIYYIGLLQVATTIATIKGGTAKTGGQLAQVAPVISGVSTTGLTTTLPNPAAAFTASTATIYAAVS